MPVNRSYSLAATWSPSATRRSECRGPCGALATPQRLREQPRRARPLAKTSTFATDHGHHRVRTNCPANWSQTFLAVGHTRPPRGMAQNPGARRAAVMRPARRSPMLGGTMANEALFERCDGLEEEKGPRAHERWSPLYRLRESSRSKRRHRCNHVHHGPEHRAIARVLP